MKILLACNIATNGKANPYTLQLLHALETHPEVTAVQHGTSWMQVPNAKFDIVHIHWPEMLVDWSESIERGLEVAREALARWSETSAIVVTIHNEHPHNRDTKIFRQLYQSVYECADALIHMGEVSKQVVRKRYANAAEETPEFVVPHGNYAWYPNKISQKEARSNLNVDPSAHIFLSFGSVRSLSEWELLKDGFRKADIQGAQLLIAGTLPFRQRTDWRHWKLRTPIALNSRIHLKEGFIPSEHVQYYMNASDVVVVARDDTLNSGVVPLGLTFGKVVVGPSTGVIGEILKNTGNPTFDSSDSETVARAMKVALKKTTTDLPDQNKIYAEHELSWSAIADQHVNVMKRTIDAKAAE